MSTPEIDLANMLAAEDEQEKLDDAYDRWVKYTVVPSLAGALAAFRYDKFDALVKHYRILNAEPIIDELFGLISDEFEIYYAFMSRKAFDVDFTEIAETYIKCLVCEQNFIDYNREVTCNDY